MGQTKNMLIESEETSGGLALELEAFKIPTFKIRASAASEILSGKIGLTDAQQLEYDALKERDKAFKAGDAKAKLTTNMVDKLNKLQHKSDHPELPQGAKTYCEKWLKEKLYERRKNFANQYLEKGIAVEDDSIKYAAENLAWGDVSKNEEWFSDDWMEGTPDVIANLWTRQLVANNEVLESETPTVIDMKNVWDCFTMPLFEQEIPTEGYETQLQVYMHLVSQEYKITFDNAILCYALMSAPLNVMEREMRKLSWEEGHQGLITDEIRQRVHREMSYETMPPSLRLKTYAVKRNPSVIDELKHRVELCREYIPTLLKRAYTYKPAEQCIYDVHPATN